MPPSRDGRRWTGWMTALLGLAVGAAAILAVPESHFFARADSLADDAPTGERWACPMMDFIGTRPGPCPVCGMALQKVTAGELTREQGRRMGVQLVTVEAGPAAMTVRASGTAAYDHRFTTLVIPRLAGRIVRRHQATAGCCQEVAAGEPVVDLYSPEAFQAQNELQTALRLGDQRLVESLTARFARWNLQPVADAIRAGKPPSDVVTITTPAAGQVLLEDFKGADEALLVGREVAADTPLLRLVDADRLALVVQVPEAQAAFLREGQPVALASDGRGELTAISARIARVANEISAETRSVEVRIYLSGARSLLRPGALVTARIRAVLGPDLAPADPGDERTWGRFPLVPAGAVLSTGVRNVAWKLDTAAADGRQRFAIAPLALGPRLEDEHGNDRFVVRAGLEPGDQVAAQGAFLIDSQAQLAGSPSLLFPLGASAPAPAHQH
ncbi:MAG: efflux RND transporter periplasmic adaptor subunit [Planctomycetes bacterium]|nr:efflux RND transporter periplasmic adaptor subunit [Planctomycetota bacterium]